MRTPFSLVLAGWLSLLLAEPVALHACAMHENGHAHSTPSVEQHREQDATPVEHEGKHHEHHEHHEPSTPSSHTAPADVPVDETEHCQCLGDCCAAAVAALPAVVVPDADVLARLAVWVPVRAHVTVRRAPDLKLPFATAPPVDLTA